MNGIPLYRNIVKWINNDYELHRIITNNYRVEIDHLLNIWVTNVAQSQAHCFVIGMHDAYLMAHNILVWSL